MLGGGEEVTWWSLGYWWEHWWHEDSGEISRSDNTRTEPSRVSCVPITLNNTTETSQLTPSGGRPVQPPCTVHTNPGTRPSQAIIKKLYQPSLVSSAHCYLPQPHLQPHLTSFPSHRIAIVLFPPKLINNKPLPVCQDRRD